MPSKETILIDLDDTMECLCESWFKWLNNKYGLHQDPNAREWDMSKNFPTLCNDQIYEPLSKRKFWKTVKPKEGATLYVKKLYDLGYNIYICTSSGYETVRNKYELIIKKYFPFISWKHVIVTHDKYMINADYLIDDGVHNLINGNYKKILFTCPHNIDYDAESNGMIRVNSWEDVYEAITKEDLLWN